jgi:hypothetical protein
VYDLQLVTILIFCYFLCFLFLVVPPGYLYGFRCLITRTAQTSRHAEAESTAESTTDEIIESDRENIAATILAINNAF